MNSRVEMNHERTVELIREIVGLIAVCGGSRFRTDWLLEQQSVLEEEQLDSQRRDEVLRAIHRHIPGMNGLVDQYLVPPLSSGYDKASANARLAELCELLFNATSVE